MIESIGLLVGALLTIVAIGMLLNEIIKRRHQDYVEMLEKQVDFYDRLRKAQLNDSLRMR